MLYAVTEPDNKDREYPIIDVFSTREAAEDFASEWSAENGGTSFEIREYRDASEVELARNPGSEW